MKAKEGKEKLQFSILSNIRFILKDILKYDKPLFWLMIISASLGVIIPYLEIYLPKVAVELILSETGTQKAIWTMFLLCLLLIVLMTIQLVIL